jgi:hypothetical protein
MKRGATIAPLFLFLARTNFNDYVDITAFSRTGALLFYPSAVSFAQWPILISITDFKVSKLQSNLGSNMSTN